MDAAELALRREIFASFAATGAPPPPPAPGDDARRTRLRALADRHVIVLDDADRIEMAHPFAGHLRGTRIRSGDRTWWGNCAWDGLGIVAALGLRDGELTSDGLTIRVEDGAVRDDGSVVFHVAVPARHWWDDIGFT